PGLLFEQVVQAFQKGDAAGQVDAPVHDVRSQFRGGLLQGGFHRGDDDVDLLLNGQADLIGVDIDDLGDAADQVPALDVHGFDLAGEGVADGGLDDFRGALADQEIVSTLDILQNGFVHLVATHPHRFGIDDARQGDDRHFGGAAADVHHHVADGLGDGQPGADGRGHRLLDEIDFPGPGRFRRLPHRPLFHRGDTRGDADDDAGPDQRAAVVYLADEVAQHGLGDFEVGDDPVLHGADGHDVARGAAQHHLGLPAHRQHPAAVPVVFAHRHHRRFAQDDAFALDVNQGIGGA